jgi:dTDP-4-amino-4,6-dideoxygalactose transaminase
MTNLQAALGVAQLGRIDEFIAGRDRILHAYRRYLDSDSLRLNPRLEGATPVNWMTCVLLNDPDRARRDRAHRRTVQRTAVEARPFSTRSARFRCTRGTRIRWRQTCPREGSTCPRILALPDADIETVSRTLLRAIESN